MYVVLFFKQKTAYEMRISDWSSDVCSSDLRNPVIGGEPLQLVAARRFEQALEIHHRWLMRGKAAIHRDHCAVDEAGFVRGQKGNDIGDIARTDRQSVV